MGQGDYFNEKIRVVLKEPFISVYAMDTWRRVAGRSVNTPLK